LFEDVFGGVTDFAGSLDYPKINVYDFDTLCDLIISGNVAEYREKDIGSMSVLQEGQETTKVIESEQYARDIDTTEIEVSDTDVAEPPAEPVLKRIRTKVKNIETVLRKAVIKPYHNINGQIEGLQISGLEKVRVAKDLFLKSGDVVRVVNGQFLSSKKVASKVFRKARKLPIMEVELLRNGKTMTFQYYLK
jgi:type II secretory pathway component PulC